MKGLTDAASTVVGLSGVLFERLQGDGVVVIFGHWHLGPGQEKRHFMEQNTTKNDLMIVICIAIREGRLTATTDEVEQILGKGPTSLDSGSNILLG